jgi:hypothetical protein
MIILLKKIFGLEPEKLETAKNILSKNDIYNLEDFEESLVDSGLKESEKMLEDSLKTKQGLEDKATGLFKAQLSIISILITIINAKIFEVPTSIMGIIWLPILFLFIGLIGSLFCLQVNDYGSLGKHPDFFLKKEIFETKEENFKFLKAYMLFDYTARINISIDSNKQKASYLKLAICCIVSSVIPLLLTTYIESKSIIIILSLLVGIYLVHRNNIDKIIKRIKNFIA